MEESGEFEPIYMAVSHDVYEEIVDGKIWVEQDETMYHFVDELLDAGVPKEDIVLGFHAADMRPLTDFAVA